MAVESLLVRGSANHTTAQSRYLFALLDQLLDALVAVHLQHVGDADVASVYDLARLQEAQGTCSLSVC